MQIKQLTPIDKPIQEVYIREEEPSLDLSYYPVIKTRLGVINMLAESDDTSRDRKIINDMLEQIR